MSMTRVENIPVARRDGIEHVDGWASKDNPMVVAYKSISSGPKWTLSVLVTVNIHGNPCDGQVGAMAVCYTNTLTELRPIAKAVAATLNEELIEEGDCSKEVVEVLVNMKRKGELDAQRK